MRKGRDTTVTSRAPTTAELTPGARVLAPSHLSVRIPWHDNGWSGSVCNSTRENTACLVLDSIRERRQDGAQQERAGMAWNKLSEAEWPPCVSERAGFMAPFEITRHVNHPYAKSSDAHSHFAVTPFRHPPFSAPCIPFRWMLRDSAHEIAQTLDLGFRQDAEDLAREAMGFHTEWVQSHENQAVLLDTFFSAVRPESSLCFFYAKQVPLSERLGRVLIAVGRVRHVGPRVEYAYKTEGKLRSLLWERAIQHSIRPDFTDGVILPYAQLLRAAEADPSIELDRHVAFVPDEHWTQFSYTSEHVSSDAALAALLGMSRALEGAARVVPGDWAKPLSWLSDRVRDTWASRGPFPGLGAALDAFGVERGVLFAHALHVQFGREMERDAWQVVDSAFRNPAGLPDDLRRFVTPTLSAKWVGLADERRSLLQLVARLDLTPVQAGRFYQPTERQGARIAVTDAELLNNPYLLYQLDRHSPDPIAVGVVDRGAFGDESLRVRFPLQVAAVSDATDPRRVSALITRVLDGAEAEGHTLMPRADVVATVRALDINPPCPIDDDLLGVVSDALGPALKDVQLGDGTHAFQLGERATAIDVIRSQIERRLAGRRHAIEDDLAALLDRALPVRTPEDDPQVEELARSEKQAALKELVASRVSVLIGPAGTGKTTLLSALCAIPDVAGGGILLLAPTGKARVQLEQRTGISAKTLAQFLLPLDRYEPRTNEYRLSSTPPARGARTVIVDEASMMTESQLAALLNGISGVERFVLVGDPRQLPPIGAGRPFIDLVAKLRPDAVATLFPRVGPAYAELTIRRRQVGQDRDDLALAEWFSGEEVGPGADEIWGRLTAGYNSQTLRLEPWSDLESLSDALLRVLADELRLRGSDDSAGFEQSLGGSWFAATQNVFFWPGAGQHADDWQILSPLRGQYPGSRELNRLLQKRFRARTLDWARDWKRRIPKPMGPEEIVYGDKVINLKNEWRKDVWPRNEALAYVANGEIGIVVGQFKTKTSRYTGRPWKLEVEFSSQPGFSYGFGGGDFGSEGDPSVELAYAITVHKAQGSEFALTFLVVPSPCRLLSRELLYTALTRQRRKVVLLYQGAFSELRRYTDPASSETAARITNLFARPKPVLVTHHVLEDRLIHRTRRGEAVRSKGEVIVADLLLSKGIDNYMYEQPLRGRDGAVRYPDFTIELAESGKTFYWEHLGMLLDPLYQARWERKLAWYREQGILPYQEGEGARGILIITQDDARKGIDSGELERLIDQVIL